MQKIVGWREWVALPELGISKIKAKVDTGARTSTLHAFHIDTFTQDGKEIVHFKIHPKQANKDNVIDCYTPVVDRRMVTDSGGHQEVRLIIKSLLVLGNISWPIEITLTNRDNMRFRMLLGRTAMHYHHLMVNPTLSFLQGKPLLKKRREV